MSGKDSSSDSSTSSDDVTLTVSPDPGFPLTFSSMVVTEELGRPFEAQLDVSSATRSGGLTNMLGCSVTVAVKLSGGTSKRYFNGVVARAVYSGLSGGSYRYRLELRPWIWLLSRRRDCQIFQNKSAWDIITGVFRTEGFTDFSDQRQSQSGDVTLDYCVQYEETLLDFTTRLMEKFGIYYHTEHQNGRHSLVFTDDPNSHKSVGKAIPYRYKQTDLRQVDEHIWEWSADLALQAGKVTLRDYNFTTPSADLTAKSNQPGSHSHGSLEVYDYPGPYLNAGDGQKIAAVHMQYHNSRREVVHASTNSRAIYAGCKFTLSDNPDTTQNREYMVIRTVTHFSHEEGRSVSRGSQIDQYTCEITAIPGSMQYRLESLTGWPRMRGPQTAKVVGESGQEITTDQYARIKVKFFWDRSDVQDENASCWIRVSQPWAGPGFGGMVIPRIGQEVIVDFLDGSPDRPIVTGCVYNATNTNADTMPANKTRSGFKTNSSPGGGGFNELRFEDKKGEEEVFLQAQFDFNVNVLNNQTTTIKKDRTTTVQQGNDSLTVSQGNRSITVSQGNDDHTVSKGNRSATVSTGNDSLTVSTGNHSITVSAGSATVSAGQSITLKVGANSIVISTSGITINGATVGVTGTGSVTVQAPSIALN
jgi:type VI secretion system secreted protein VgrG